MIEKYTLKKFSEFDKICISWSIILISSYYLVFAKNSKRIYSLDINIVFVSTENAGFVEKNGVRKCSFTCSSGKLRNFYLVSQHKNE